MENINDQLGKLDCWKDKTCVDCGRKPAESRLSIEGMIHHATPLRCVDRKSCERIKRRQFGANGKAQPLRADEAADSTKGKS